MPSIRVNLSEPELEALRKLAQEERRRVEPQAAALIVAVLEARGLLPSVITESAIKSVDTRVPAGTGLAP